MSSEVRARGAEDWIGSRRTDAKSVQSTEPEILPSGIKPRRLRPSSRRGESWTKNAVTPGETRLTPHRPSGRFRNLGNPVTAGLDPKTWRSSSFTWSRSSFALFRVLPVCCAAAQRALTSSDPNILPPRMQRRSRNLASAWTSPESRIGLRDRDVYWDPTRFVRYANRKFDCSPALVKHNALTNPAKKAFSTYADERLIEIVNC